jgi:hypothetical protein
MPQGSVKPLTRASIFRGNDVFGTPMSSAMTLHRPPATLGSTSKRYGAGTRDLIGASGGSDPRAGAGMSISS